MTPIPQPRPTPLSTPFALSLFFLAGACCGGVFGSLLESAALRPTLEAQDTALRQDIALLHHAANLLHECLPEGSQP